MCAIVGLIGANCDSLEVVSESLNRLRHRGPNGISFFSDNQITIGHARLAIIDKNKGDQPFHSACGRYVIVFNGEVYNYVELRSRLTVKGFVFRSGSDTEVLLYLLIDGGVNALNLVEGMFAFAFYDRQIKTLLVARDRLGVKPLYYMEYKGGLRFASELKSFFDVLTLNDIDKSSIAEYLALGYVRSPRTPFNSVKKLLPGHTIEFKNSTISISKWWVIDFKKFIGLEIDDVPHVVESLVHDSVRLRLRCDANVAATLSGGIDSSVIASEIEAVMPSSVHYLTVNYNNNVNDIAAALGQARLLNVEKHDIISVTYPAEQQVLVDLFYSLDEPNSDSAWLGTAAVCEAAKRKGYDVLLSGIGGDEVFGGYKRYRGGSALEKFYQLMPIGFQSNFNLLLGKFGFEYLNWAAAVNAKPVVDRMHRVSRIFSDDEIASAMGGSFEVEPFCNSAFPTNQNDLANTWMAMDLQAYLPDQLLAMTDRMSMKYGLEVREPFLDSRLVEIMCIIPSCLKFDHSSSGGKKFLRSIYKKRLHPLVTNGTKSGFGGPIKFFLLSRNFSFISNIILNGKLVENGVISRVFVQQKLKKINRNSSQLEVYQLWTIFSLEMWFLSYFK